MGRQVSRGDLHGDAEERDRAHAVALPREGAGTLAEDAQRRVEVLKRLKRAREAPDRVDVAVFPDELAVGRLCLTQVPADKQVRRRLARQTMVARDPRLAETSAAFGERLRELAGLLVVHDLRGGLPSALRER